MSQKSYIELASQHLSDCDKYEVPREDATFDILCMAEDYADEEVKSTFTSLPSEVLQLAQAKLNAFNKTGEYYVISSTGTTKDLSGLMKRLSKLI